MTRYESPLNFHGWVGSGYIIMDPETGAGAYLIGGGMNGGYYVNALNEMYVHSLGVEPYEFSPQTKNLLHSGCQLCCVLKSAALIKAVANLGSLEKAWGYSKSAIFQPWTVFTSAATFAWSLIDGLVMPMSDSTTACVQGCREKYYPEEN